MSPSPSTCCMLTCEGKLRFIYIIQYLYSDVILLGPECSRQWRLLPRRVHMLVHMTQLTLSFNLALLHPSIHLSPQDSAVREEQWICWVSFHHFPQLSHKSKIISDVWLPDGLKHYPLFRLRVWCMGFEVLFSSQLTDNSLPLVRTSFRRPGPHSLLFEMISSFQGPLWDSHFSYPPCNWFST